MKRILLVLVSSFLFLSAAQAAPEGDAAAVSGSDERNHAEEWYWGFNLGGASLKFKDGALDRAVDQLKNMSEVDHGTYYFDLFFLWPLSGHQTAIGVSAGGLVDHYRADVSDEDLNLNVSLLAFSAHHYFMGQIGDGLFARGDIGLAGTGGNYKVGSTKTDFDTERGLGLRLGLGYSILLSNETRLPLTVQYQNAFTAEDSGSSAFVFTAGLMF